MSRPISVGDRIRLTEKGQDFVRQHLHEGFTDVDLTNVVGEVTRDTTEGTYFHVVMPFKVHEEDDRMWAFEPEEIEVIPAQ